MKTKWFSWGRMVGGNVAAVYFLTHVAFAYSPEKNLWDERRRHLEKTSAGQVDNLLLASLPAASISSTLFQTLPTSSRIASALSDDLAKSLPLSVTEDHAKLFSALQTTHGTIRKVWLPKTKVGERVVVHIQDVHQNMDAQRNIGGAIESLWKAGQSGVVGLEGSWEKIDVATYHNFENREAILLAADYLLRENKITGPVHMAMTTPAPLGPMVGIDDPIHYPANVEAYRQSAPKMEAYKKTLGNKKFQLAQEKKRLFSTELQEFDMQVEDYHTTGTNLEKYLLALRPEMGEGNAGLLARAFEMERAIDFKKVEKDRENLIASLVKSLSSGQIEALIQQSVGYRAGQVRYGAFYTYVNELCRGAKIDLARFPHMDAYIKYVMVTDRIDAEALLAELNRLEKARYAALVKTDGEKELVARSRAVSLAGRLLTFELTPEDWADYAAMNAGNALGEDMASFEAFYKEAHARDASMAENMVKAMDNGGHKTGVIVTGGYHTTGVSEELMKRGVTVVTFTPRIEKIETENGSSYLSIFTQEKTPLEKLFAGQKLFLGSNPQGSAPENAVVTVAAVGAKGSDPQSAAKAFGISNLINGFRRMKDGTFEFIVSLKEAVRVVSTVENGQLTVRQGFATALTLAVVVAMVGNSIAPIATAFFTSASLMYSHLSVVFFMGISNLSQVVGTAVIAILQDSRTILAVVLLIFARSIKDGPRQIFSVVSSTNSPTRSSTKSSGGSKISMLLFLLGFSTMILADTGSEAPSNFSLNGVALVALLAGIGVFIKKRYEIIMVFFLVVIYYGIIPFKIKRIGKYHGSNINNKVFKVTSSSGKHYAFIVHREDGQTVQTEIDSLERYKKGLVPEVIGTIFKKKRIMLGSQVMTLRVFLEGTPGEWMSIADQQLINTATALAQLHENGGVVTVEKSLKEDFNEIVQNLKNLNSKGFSRNSSGKKKAYIDEITGLLSEVIEIAKGIKFNTRSTDDLVGARIHGDPHPQNIIFDSSGKVVGFIDFIRSKEYFRIRDLASPTLEGEDNTLDLNKVQQEILAYDAASNKKLTDDELAALPLVFYMEILNTLIFFTELISKSNDGDDHDEWVNRKGVYKAKVMSLKKVNEYDWTGLANDVKQNRMQTSVENPVQKINPNNLLFLLTGRFAREGALMDAALISVAVFMFPGVASIVVLIFGVAHGVAIAFKSMRGRGISQFTVNTAWAMALALPYLLASLPTVLAVVPFAPLIAGVFHVVADMAIMGYRDAHAFAELMSISQKDRLEKLFPSTERPTESFSPSLRTIQRMGSVQRTPVMGFVYSLAFRLTARMMNDNTKTIVNNILYRNNGSLIGALFGHSERANNPNAINVTGKHVTHEEMGQISALVEAVARRNEGQPEAKKEYIVLRPTRKDQVESLRSLINESKYLQVAEWSDNAEESVNAFEKAVKTFSFTHSSEIRVIMASQPWYQNAESSLNSLIGKLSSDSMADELRIAIARADLNALHYGVRLVVQDIIRAFEAAKFAAAFA